MALSFHENQSKRAGKMPALQGNDVVLCVKDRGRGVVLRGRKRKASLTYKEVSYIDAGAYVVDKPNADPSTALGMTSSRHTGRMRINCDRAVSSYIELGRRAKRKPRRNQMGKLDGKVALVTGGNSGIGLATAKRFVNEGAHVYITGRREAELAAAVKEIGKNVTGVQGDVAKLADLDRLFAQIKREKGKLDIVFANAGIATYAALGDITEEHFDSIFDTNVKGLLFTVQKALPLMPDGAAIILNASIVGSKGLPANSVYSATKAALRSFARTWTTDLKDRHIRVNAVSPGVIDTPGLSKLLASSDVGEQRSKAISSGVPLGRRGTPDEIAKAVVFLASDDSSYVTGAELFVDGGFAQV
jgi:NAD(P)-dependent dehydrogenase (short-subunit alcohol dehydrogenase family)